MRGPWSGALRLWEGLGISGEVPGPRAQDLLSMLAYNRKEQTDTAGQGQGEPGGLLSMGSHRARHD